MDLVEKLALRDKRKQQWLAIYDAIVIVAGSRNFNDYSLFNSVMLEWLADNPQINRTPWTFLSGDARDGADKMIKRFAGLVDEHYQPIRKTSDEFECQLLPALWDDYGKRAGMLRNHEMGDIGTHLVAFWDKSSRGTLDMITYARSKNLHVSEVWVNPDE